MQLLDRDNHLELLSNDLLFPYIPKGELDEAIAFGENLGRIAYTLTAEHYGKLSAPELARRLGLELMVLPRRRGSVLYNSLYLPDQKKVILKDAGGGPRSTMYRLCLRHEIFHHLETVFPELCRKWYVSVPVVWRVTVKRAVRAVNEIGAHTYVMLSEGLDTSPCAMM